MKSTLRASRLIEKSGSETLLCKFMATHRINADRVVSNTVQDALQKSINYKKGFKRNASRVKQ